MKNHFGYHDDIRIEPVQTNKLDSLPTKEEIVRKLPGKISDNDNDVDLSELLEE
jgi:hypothetical protein